MVRWEQQQIKEQWNEFFIVFAIGTTLKFKLLPRWTSNQSKSWTNFGPLHPHSRRLQL